MKTKKEKACSCYVKVGHDWREEVACALHRGAPVLPDLEIKNVFQFSELEDSAKERAKSDYCECNGYVGADDALASIQALAKHFGGKMKDWSVDFFCAAHSHAEFRMPEGTEPEEIEKLLKELGDGSGQCKLTGYCLDEDVVDGFRKAFDKGERELEALMQAAFESWLWACQSDAEYQYSDEAFAENCEANEYRFDETGRMV